MTVGVAESQRRGGAEASEKLAYMIPMLCF